MNLKHESNEFYIRGHLRPSVPKKERVMKKENWKTVIHIIVSILTAIATTLGVTSCMR